MTTRHEYYLDLAEAVKAAGTCFKKVGAVLVRDDRILSTGFNGTASGLPNCNDGGCARCANPENYVSGPSFDLCVCVHAEANALLTAARFGVAVEGAVVYSTVQPCFSCSKHLLQAGITNAYFRDDWIDERYSDSVTRDYLRLQGALRAVQVRSTGVISTPSKTASIAPGVSDATALQVMPTRHAFGAFDSSEPPPS